MNQQEKVTFVIGILLQDNTTKELTINLSSRMETKRRMAELNGSIFLYNLFSVDGSHTIVDFSSCYVDQDNEDGYGITESEASQSVLESLHYTMMEMESN